FISLHKILFQHDHSQHFGFSNNQLELAAGHYAGKKKGVLDPTPPFHNLIYNSRSTMALIGMCTPPFRATYSSVTAHMVVLTWSRLPSSVLKIMVTLLWSILPKTKARSKSNFLSLWRTFSRITSSLQNLTVGNCSF